MRPNWVELSRSALLHNHEQIRRRVAPGSRICAVVKANAYGHDAAFCALALRAAGVEWFGVTSPEEGGRLRAAGLDGRILVMGGFTAHDAALLLEQNLTPAVWNEEQLEWLEQAARRFSADCTFPIHVKIDSGMGRLGLVTCQEDRFCSRLSRLPQLQAEALFSHLSSSDAEDVSISCRQHQRFAQARQRLCPRLPVHAGRFWHLLNSSGIFRFTDWSGGMVRAGLALYGYVLGVPDAGLRPVLTWKTRILSLKTLPAGAPVGYGERYRTTRPTRVAVLAVGYGDGYSRAFSSGGAVLVAGRLAPVIGNISMDLTTIDVTGIPEAALGDEVTLLGANPAQPVDATGLARLAGTIPYEVLCAISARVHREFVD